MKKIFNWTFGSIFRTFGRIIAYIIIGTIVSLILSRSDFRITDLFLDNVKASENYTSGLVPSPFYYSNSARTNALSLISITGGSMTFVGYTESLSLDAYYITREYNFYFSNRITNTSSANTLIVPLVLQNLQTRLNISGTILLFDTQGGVYTCELVGNSSDQLFYNIICPFKQGRTLDFIGMNVNIRSQSGNQAFRVWDIGISPFYTLRLDTNQDVINNQNQNTQSIIIQEQNNTQQIIQQQESSSNQTQQTIIDSTNQTISAITDSSSPDMNGTLDNNTIAGWLPPGPIDSIVTLPLTLLNSLFNAMGGACADLVVPLPFVNKNLNIPCMSRIYNDMSFTSFFNWIGVVASAFILYKYLLRLYKWIDATLTLRENTQVDWGGD